MKIKDLLLLTESKSAPLYHATQAGEASEIISDNKLYGYTIHTINDTDYKGVSLTRSLQFAKNWVGNVYGNGGVIFELDQEKLNQKYKIVPIDYFSTSSRSKDPKDARRQGKFAEAEEFAITPKIDNLDQYIVHILIVANIANEWKQRLEQEKSGGKDYCVSFTKRRCDDIRTILNHPKLKII